MARLTSAERKALPLSDFAEPSKRKYPVNNKEHAIAAEGFATMHHAPPAVKARIDHMAEAKGVHPHKNLGAYLHPKKRGRK